MEEEWGVTSIGDVLVEKELPSRPVAAASLGDVVMALALKSLKKTKSKIDKCR